MGSAGALRSAMLDLIGLLSLIAVKTLMTLMDGTATSQILNEEMGSSADYKCLHEQFEDICSCMD